MVAFLSALTQHSFSASAISSPALPSPLGAESCAVPSIAPVWTTTIDFFDVLDDEEAQLLVVSLISTWVSSRPIPIDDAHPAGFHLFYLVQV